MMVLGRAEVEALLAPDALIEAVRSALVDLSAGRASMPNRIAAWSAQRAGLLGAMVAYVPSLDVLAAKLVSLFPHNVGVPTHQAAILVFDAKSGTPIALLDGTEITAQRTAAASALATRLLAREDAAVLAIVGTGVQAESHARYVARVRSFREVRVAGRDRARTAALAARIGAAAAPDIEAAVRGADVICAATHADQPVVRRAWLKAGAHLNSVGFQPEASELDGDIFRGALLAVESRSSAFAPPPAGAPELRGLDAALAVELGELAAGTRSGRASAEQITVYKSVGVAVEDAAAAALVLRGARQRGLGTTVSL
jgi:ornithine cyclodeaminase